MEQIKEKKVLIAGHKGMVGSAIFSKLSLNGYKNILLCDRNEADLTRQIEVETLFDELKPEYVIVAAAKVGGILANNSYRAQFIYDNLMIQSNIIHSAFNNQVEKLIFLGSSCIYPKFAPQPMKEEYLLTGTLEFTNEPYAIAKIAGIKMCESYYRQYGSNFFSVMPTNLYGPNDNFNLMNSHVLPAIIRKAYEAKKSDSDKIEVWGTGKPRREFLYVDDLADAIEFLIRSVDAKDIYESGISHLNIGTGEDISISEMTGLICDIVGFSGKIEYDENKPDGTPRKLLDVSRLNNLGWKYSTELINGIQKSYQWFLDNYEKVKL